MRLILRVLVCLLLILCVGSKVNATIISGAVTFLNPAGSGSFVKLTPPLGNPFGPANSVGNDTFQDDNLYGFDEGQNIVLTANLNVDDLANGVGGGTGAGILSAGTVVASHYVFFDPLGNTTQKGYVEFDSNILAVLSSTSNLANSDFLINTGVNYLNPVARGLEAGDDVIISGLKRIDVDWFASSPGDFIRVLTAHSPGAVPEPTTLAIWVTLGGLGLIAARRRAKHAA